MNKQKDCDKSWLPVKTENYNKEVTEYGDILKIPNHRRPRDATQSTVMPKLIVCPSVSDSSLQCLCEYSRWSVETPNDSLVVENG